MIKLKSSSATYRRGNDAKQSYAIDPEFGPGQSRKSNFSRRVEKCGRMRKKQRCLLEFPFGIRNVAYEYIKMSSELVRGQGKEPARYIRMLEGTIRRLEAELEEKERIESWEIPMTKLPRDSRSGLKVIGLDEPRQEAS